ncbi:hypothetical protein GCM10007857_82660 [Bradyrhizobium iriomotense]|uniref:Uncharacterized protein n=1 Tax=Bradyrhizobium iriomotense TaxID=441950 RepID=A0ABQ6BCN9_9BRAD|nr:hypothetical protein GCM10007857_82660 [Bradyrhizobium iriomotense]
METMRLPELGNSGALPRVPSLDAGTRAIFRVSLQNRDAVTVATKHDCCTQSNHAAAANQDFAHPFLPSKVVWRDEPRKRQGFVA